MRKRFTMALAAMAVLCFAVAAPTASARTSKAEGKQNKALKSYGKSLKKNSKDDKIFSKRTRGAGTAIKALQFLAGRADKNATTVLAAAPAIIKGLTDLQAGLVAAGAGLNSLKTLAGATEYGITQVSVISAGPVTNPQVGSFVVTPDVPDAAQQGQTTQNFVANNTGALAVSYGVRSNETDGTGATNPAALCRVTVTNEGGDIQSTTGGPIAGLGGFVPVNVKSPLTSTTAGNEGFPFGPKTTGADADVLTTLVTGINVVANDSYSVSMSCVDTSPSATDPSA